MSEPFPADRTNRAETIQAWIDLAAAFRCAVRLNMHEGVCNHFSMMLPGRRFLINPKGTHFERMTASSLIVIDENGRTLEGTGRPPMTGYHIHTRIHLAHPSATVVLHLHAPYSTAITAIRGGRVEMVHQNSARFLGEIAYDDHFNGIAVRTGEGDRMAEAMGGKRILFLANHGVIVVGRTVAQAFDDFYYLERAYQVSMRPSSPSEARICRRRIPTATPAIAPDANEPQSPPVNSMIIIESRGRILSLGKTRAGQQWRRGADRIW